MTLRSEEPSQTPIEERLKAAYQQTLGLLVDHINRLSQSQDENFAPLVEGIATNGVQMFWGTETYSKHMENASINATRRPFGIEMRTLSPGTQLVLYPRTIFKPDEDVRQLAIEEGLEVREEGPQTMIYFLDEFEAEAGNGNMYDLAANLIFVSHMVGAALNNRYPLNKGERSAEFLGEVKTGLITVQKYISDLSSEQRSQLSMHIVKVGSLDEDGLVSEAKRIVSYDTEPMKMPGLYESEGTDVHKQTPVEAVNNNTFYLHLEERGLPQRVRGETTTDVPSLPWVEYGKNRWNRSHQLFGRYESPIDEGFLRVDFRLDSTHMPALYGFFGTIEITREIGVSIREHILFGQEMGDKAPLLYAQFFGAPLTPEQLQDSVVPIIIAGDFDFTNSETRELLGKLAEDKGAKPDVGRVVSDILRLSEQGKLKRLV